MNTEFNPYQPPQSGLNYDIPSSSSSSSFRVEGKFLVIPLSKEEQVLPKRCIHCNKPVETLIKRKFYKSSPWLLLLILINLILYLVVALIARKKMTLRLGICREHQKKRGVNLLIGLLLIFIGIVSGYVFIDFIYIGIIIAIIGTAYIIIASPLLLIHKIKNNLVYFKRCGEPFLTSLLNNDE